MAEIGGAWECSVETPVGPRTFIVDLAPSGNQFQARVRGNFGEMNITDGKLAEDVMTWSMTTKKPMSMNLNCTAVVSGDALSGTVSAGVFGKYPLKGKRL